MNQTDALLLTAILVCIFAACAAARYSNKCERKMQGLSTSSEVYKAYNNDVHLFGALGFAGLAGCALFILMWMVIALQGDSRLFPHKKAATLSQSAPAAIAGARSSFE